MMLTFSLRMCMRSHTTRKGGEVLAHYIISRIHLHLQIYTIVLGYAAYRIGSSCEFDWCAESIRTIQQLNDIGSVPFNT